MPQDVQDNLTIEEREFLCRGLGEWGGPARCTEQFAIGMGFEGLDQFPADIARLREAIEAGEPLSHQDWRRVLLATEVVFVSDVVGSGLDWSITTGFSDSDSIGLLRRIQRKMPRWRSTFQFTFDQQGEVVISEPERPDGHSPAGQVRAATVDDGPQLLRLWARECHHSARTSRKRVRNASRPRRGQVGPIHRC